jgi:hypothetical protein
MGFRVARVLCGNATPLLTRWSVTGVLLHGFVNFFRSYEYCNFVDAGSTGIDCQTDSGCCVIVGEIGKNVIIIFSESVK